MRSALPFVFAMAGCDLVFGLGDRIEADAAPESDAPELDAPPPCVERTGTVVAINDAMLINEATCNPANRWGAGININVGQSGSNRTRSRVLLRFSLTDEMRTTLQPGGGFARGTLTLPLKPVACPGTCGSSVLGLSMFAAHNDWNEGLAADYNGVAWCARKQTQQTSAQTVPWQTPGADGVADRGRESLGDTMLTQAQADADTLELPFGESAAAITEIAGWIDGSQLTILVIPTTTTGTLFVKSREHPGGGGAQLSITSCR